MTAMRWKASLLVALVWAFAPGAAWAQRELHWEALDVDARLDARGTLHVVERQTMVFSGDWNGGERRFNIRPRQALEVTGIDRVDPATGVARPLAPDPSIDDPDEFSQIDGSTWRWRSRRVSDPPFQNTRIVYVLHYQLANILLGDGTAAYRLDHDFAFPDRDGVIERVTVRLTLDPAWTAVNGLEEVYRGGPLDPGDSFTLRMPLQYAGAGVPGFLDTRRPPRVVLAVEALAGVTALAIALLFIREQRRGRFAPLPLAAVDEGWLRSNLLAHPAEVVGAAWDENIGSPEVVALLARLAAERKLESTVKGSTMRLRLLVDRDEFRDHEAALIEGLFFDPKRRDTSTDAVKLHYRKTGFNPVERIKKDLGAAVAALVQDEKPPLVRTVITLALFLVGAGAMALDMFLNFADLFPLVLVGGAIIGAALLQIPGLLFRARMKWGRLHAIACLLPALLVLAAMLAFLWWRVGTGFVQPSNLMLGGGVALVLWMIVSSINALKSRQSAEGIAFRKRLTTAREYFKTQFTLHAPALRDEWYPWILAFGLGNDADRWATTFAPLRTGTSRTGHSSSGGSVFSGSSSDSSGGGWTGAAGGRSGGAGGGAAWTAAATSMAAGVSPPSSSGSGGGGGSSSSSSGGSSGGGGGGGW